jgi:hypothetical protein
MARSPFALFNESERAAAESMVRKSLRFLGAQPTHQIWACFAILRTLRTQSHTTHNFFSGSNREKTKTFESRRLSRKEILMANKIKGQNKIQNRNQNADQDKDQPVLGHIDRLVKEEERLYGRSALNADDRARLADLKVELDQCWDLLRQRRALREFGEDPGKAKVRPAKIVENYEQ